MLHLDIKQLHFQMKGNLRAQELTFVAVLSDDGGNFVVGKETGIEFALQEATFNRMSAGGLSVTLTLQAPPGTCRLRGVVEEGLDSKVAA